MLKIIATIIKEWQLMRRDVSGLLLLLVMPVTLAIVMALIEDAPFRDYQEMRFDLLLADNDHGTLARQITDGLKQSKNFHVTDSADGRPLTEERLKQLLQQGNYKIGIVIPNGVTAEMVNAANIVVNNISEKIGMTATMPTREVRPQMYVRLYFDPVSKPAYRNAISTVLDKFITMSCTGVLMQRLSLLNKNAASENSNPGDLKKIMQGIGIKEEPLNDRGRETLHVNSVQHNVPAWAIFGMFFIIIPIAGHIIKEREDGSALRIGLIPGASGYVTIGKIIFYTLICCVQFMLMLCVGLWAMPVFGLPPLYPGAHPWLLLPVSLCIGFAATAFGIFTGSAFKTITQASPFGSVSIILFSAIGGIWIPIEVLPRAMQKLALVSPLHWSLEAVNQVMLRDGDLSATLLPLFVLLSTGFMLWGATIFMKKK